MAAIETLLGRPPARSWQAKWIAGPEIENNTYFYFRKEVLLRSNPKTVSVYITADTRYQLFVNGAFVGRGPVQSQPFFHYYDEFDLTPILKRGKNCVAVVVNYVGNIADARPGLLAEAVGAKGKRVFATNDSWRTVRADAWQQHTYFFGMNARTPYQEVFDARRVPAGWDQVGFDDSHWPAARVLAGRTSNTPPAVTPWSFLQPRDIPHMTAEECHAETVVCREECLDLENRPRREDLAPGLSMVGKPIKHSVLRQADNLLKAAGQTVARCSTRHRDLDFDGVYDPCVVLDFGRILTGYVRLDLTGPAGGRIDLGYCERLIDDHFNIALENSFADRYVMTAGRQAWQSFTWKSFRYVKIRLRSCFENVKIHSLKAVISTYPYADRGGLTCSDKRLQKVFDICRHTTRLCSNEFLMDTPWREQAQWLGDVAAVTVPAIYACFGDTAITGKFYRQAAANQHQTGMISNVSNKVNHGWQGAIPDYSLWWLMGLWQHYLYTGDAGIIHDLYPNAVNVIQAHTNYLNRYGLIENMPYWVFIDWAPTDRRGECTAYNALFYGGLRALAEMAALKEDAHTRKLCRGLRRLMAKNFTRRLFDKKAGVFRDCRYEGKLSTSISEHGNAAPICFGLCNAAATKSIVEAIFARKTVPAVEAQPFFSAVVLNAFAKIGRFDLALRYIDDRWGKRMVDKGAESAYEEWYRNGSWRNGDWHGFLRTESHAWSAYPACFLVQHLIGLEILEPGGARIRLKPQPTAFDYKVRYPLPAGIITVANKAGRITVCPPEGVVVAD